MALLTPKKFPDVFSSGCRPFRKDAFLGRDQREEFDGGIEGAFFYSSNLPVPQFIFVVLVACLAPIGLFAQPVEVQLRPIQQRVQNHIQEARSVTVAVHDPGRSCFGTGIMISEDGLLLTAAHVALGGMRNLDVILSDGTKLKGRMLAKDHEADVALIKVQSNRRFAAARFGTPWEMAKSEWCFALGFPENFDPDRPAPVRIGQLNGRGKRLRTSCKLSAGDSGGPLFNMRGEVIGLHHAVGKDVTQNSHIPIEICLKVAEEYIAKPSFRVSVRGWPDESERDFGPEPVKLLNGDDRPKAIFMAEVRRSMLRLKKDGKQIALATLVADDGTFLTKASEISEPEKIKAETFLGQSCGISVLHIFKDYDLALLRLSRKFAYLRAIPLSRKAPELGAITMGTSSRGFQVATVSVQTRDLEHDANPTLGIAVKEQGGGLVVTGHQYYTGKTVSSLPLGTRILIIDDAATPTIDRAQKVLMGKSVLDDVKLFVRSKNGLGKVSLRMGQGNKSPISYEQRNRFFSAMKVTRNSVATGFRAAFQHDGEFLANDAGAPLVDLNGACLGVQISRAGRHKCYAIPSSVIVDLLTGKIPNKDKKFKEKL